MATERELGDDWAELMRANGLLVQKLPAGMIAGIPDWLTVGDGHTTLIEAKHTLRRGRLAFNPKQLTGAQDWFLRQVWNHGGEARVLVLDEAGWLLLHYPVQRITRELFTKGCTKWQK